MSEVQIKEVVVPYRPRPWQRELHQTRKRFTVIVAHRGSGKSYWAINELIKSAMTGPPNSEFAYVLPMQNQARRNVLPHLQRFVAPIPDVKIRNQTMETIFPNGNRLHLLGSDNPDSIRGLHLHGICLDEVDDMSPTIWTVVRPTLTTHRGSCVWIGTPKGRKQLWEFYNRSQEPERNTWMGIILPYQKTEVLTEDEVEAIRSEMSPEAFAQEMECSFDAALVSAYYGHYVAELRANGRIAVYDPPLYREDLTVYTAWDLGIRDRTAVLYFQILGDVRSNDYQIHFVDWDEYDSLGLAEWATIINKKPYRYECHIAPHDIKVHEIGTGISRLESADQVGLHFEVCPKQSIEDGIELCRRHLPRTRWDLSKCSGAVDAISAYRSKLDRNNDPIAPLHDWASHTADALRYCVTYVAQVLSQPAMLRVPLIRI